MRAQGERGYGRSAKVEAACFLDIPGGGGVEDHRKRYGNNLGARKGKQPKVADFQEPAGIRVWAGKQPSIPLFDQEGIVADEPCAAVDQGEREAGLSAA